jgi:Flp pilus assembly protein TadG
MRRALGRLGKDLSGAVAPTLALSLFGLIAVGGIAFDYARMAGMDSELQSAADQAALAAASQLDGDAGAIARATAAANSLITNKTLFASDGTSRNVGIATVIFCSAFDDSNPDTDAACTRTTLDSNAHVAWVQINGRTADFALTPIVGALSSGVIGAEAVGGMSSAICKEPPVMMCNPSTTPGTFNVDNFVGKGIRLVAKGSGGSYAPGDFGWLDVGAGAADLQKLMGYGSPPDNCVDVTQPTTETGAMTSVIDAYNTRFDIYDSGDNINCFGSSLCPPSKNSRKDVIRTTTVAPTKQNCGVLTGGGGQGWRVGASPYRPVTTPTTDPKYVGNYTATPDAMGYPRDKCAATSLDGTCTPSARIGTGDWDINAYWRVNHPPAASYPTSLNATIRAAAPSSADAARAASATQNYPTRYQVYKWEMANAAGQLGSRTVGALGTDYGQPICRPPGVTPASQAADRRVMPVAVVNCTGLSGKKPVNPIDWIDTFLVEPSISRDNGLNGSNKVVYTNVGDIYVEVIGPTSTNTGGTTNQFVRHDKPYLIR